MYTFQHGIGFLQSNRKANVHQDHSNSKCVFDISSNFKATYNGMTQNSPVLTDSLTSLNLFKFVILHLVGHSKSTIDGLHGVQLARNISPYKHSEVNSGRVTLGRILANVPFLKDNTKKLDSCMQY